jgi:hypothetical protein
MKARFKTGFFVFKLENESYMFKYLKEHSADLIAVRVTGKLDKADYDSLIPEAEEKLNRYGKVSVYWEMADFDGWQLSGIWPELKFDIKHLNDFVRVAIVGDKTWESMITNMAKPFTTAEIHFFELTEREQAMAWVKGMNNDE